MSLGFHSIIKLEEHFVVAYTQPSTYRCFHSVYVHSFDIRVWAERSSTRVTGGPYSRQVVCLLLVSPLTRQEDFFVAFYEGGERADPFAHPLLRPVVIKHSKVVGRPTEIAFGKLGEVTDFLHDLQKHLYSNNQ